MEESLGLLTAVTEITRSASKASRGLVQISSRLTQVLDDQSSTGQKLKDIYSGLGIALFDNEGQIRSTYDILEDLSKQWDNLSKNEQEYIENYARVKGIWTIARKCVSLQTSETITHNQP